MNTEPNIQDCFNLYESIRMETRLRIKQLEELKHMMSKRWEEEINTIIQTERNEDKFFGHERSDIADVYRVYKSHRLRNKMPIDVFESYLMTLFVTKHDHRFLGGCLPIFSAMFEQESKTKVDTGE